MSSSCSAYQAACQEQCRADIPFFKFGQRQNCINNCAAQYAQCYAELTQQVEEQSNDAAAAVNDTMKKLIIAIILVVVVIFLVFLFIKFRKK